MIEEINSYPSQEKKIIFMRHGRVGRFPGRKSEIYDFLHNKKKAVFPWVKKSIKSFSPARWIYWCLDKRVRGYVDSESNYEKLDYEKFMQLMLHKVDLPLAAYDNGINLKGIPLDTELIYHSPALRSFETAEFVKSVLKGNPQVDDSCSDLIAEVQFSDDIITKEEFKKREGLAGCRDLILCRWHNGKNIEPFRRSLERAEELRQYLLSRPEKTILVITHGWYLRLLKLFFEKKLFLNKETHISYDELVEAKPPNYGEFFQVNLIPDVGYITVSASPDEKLANTPKPISTPSPANTPVSDSILVTDTAPVTTPIHMYNRA